VAEVINVKILEDIFRNVEGNTKQLVDAGAVGERSAVSLSIIQVHLRRYVLFIITESRNFIVTTIVVTIFIIIIINFPQTVLTASLAFDIIDRIR
jgi:hypothetical protein